MDDLISRQAAIDAVNNERCEHGMIKDILCDKILISAKDRIRRLPSAQPTQADTSNTLKALDCVERQAAIDALKRNTLRLTVAEEWNCEGHVAWDAEVVYSEVMEGMLLDLPSAQPNLQPTRCEECEAFNKTRLLIPQPERKWIPCSERLPEEAYPVIVTWKNDDPASYYQFVLGKHYTGVAHYKNGKWFWYSSITEDVLMEYGRCDSEEFDEAIKVLAWIPLPEPYREEGGE